MKLTIVFLTCVFAALAAGREIQDIVAAKDRSLSSEIVDLILAWQKQMPCGFEGLGIPPLAPLKAEHRELHISTESLILDGIVDKFRLNGLDGFDIEEFKISPILSKATFKFHWHDINLKTMYQVLMQMTGDTKVKMSRLGNAKFSMKDFMVWGTIRYSLGVISGNLRLKECRIYASVGDVVSDIENLSNIKFVNRKLNEIIAETVTIMINDNTEALAELTNTIVVPLANNIIGDKSLADLIGIITGGGGGGSGGETEKQECIPPVIPDF